jgi:hypothetical protein
MKSLNSVGDARRVLLGAGVGVFIALLFLAPLAVFAAGSVTITLDKATYAGTQTIHVSGTVTPAPSSSGTNIAISITGPTGGTVDANQFPVSASTGNYNATFVTGGTSYAINGTYTVAANYNGATASTTFVYGTPKTSGGGGNGTTTTLIISSITTIVQPGSTVVTTVVQPGVTTTVVQPGVTTTINSNVQTTTTLSYTGGSDSTALAVGAVGLIIGIIAAVIAVLAMRKK